MLSLATAHIVYSQPNGDSWSETDLVHPKQPNQAHLCRMHLTDQSKLFSYKCIRSSVTIDLISFDLAPVSRTHFLILI